MNGKPFTRPFLCADMLRKAVGKVSYDVRTSMNAIVGSTDLMARESDMSDKMHTHIKKDTVSLAELPCDETRSCRL